MLFRSDYGNYVGGTFSLLWTGLAVYSIYIIWSMDKSKEKNKDYYWAGPGITLLLVLIANGYYFNAKGKAKNKEELNSTKSTYANISLIPIYLIVAAVGILILVNIK